MQNNYTQQPPYPTSKSETSSKALISLILGILSYFVCPLVFGIVAWVLGASELNDIKENKSSPDNKAMAMAGMWLGIINVIIVFLTIIIIVILIMFFAFTIPFVSVS
ncbi:MAG: DUF4190 domain-containing protein [Ignavibacteria bacterium]|nr:DUF4190 domain-containing protein [Ignavibacteria bacterium]